MLLTVCLNPAIDKTMSVPGFAAGRTNRAVTVREEAGGKAVNVARAARRLGCSVTTVGFLAGTNGKTISSRLEADGVPYDFLEVPGQTRTNLKIKDPETEVETEINEPGFPVSPDHIRRMEEKVAHHASGCGVVAFSGSLPPGAPDDLYARLIRIAASSGARTILDCGGPALRYGVAAAPDLVKPNRAETAEFLGCGSESGFPLIEGAETLLAAGARAAVISLGPEGAIGMNAEGAWRAFAPVVRVASTVGAGDAMVAALARGMLCDLAFPEALRLATAAGCAAAASEGGGYAKLLNYEELADRVRVTPLRGR